jgi:hypothetical protein
MLLPISCAILTLLAFLLLWAGSRRTGQVTPANDKSPLPVAARTLSPPNPAPPALNLSNPGVAVSPLAESSALSKTASGNPLESGMITPERLSSSGPGVVPPKTTLTAADSSLTDTNNPGTTERTVAPAPLKLQGIVFNPKRPSALIHGRVLFVGDHIRDLRINAIRPDNVVLTGVGTNLVLSLEP